jgi:hypothetical protein
MNKARTGKALSAAAAANLAVVGFAAGPASAATHAAANVTGTTAAAAVPSAGRTLPGLVLSAAARQANAIRAQARGFVPKSRAGIKPDLWKSGCTGHVCIGASVYSYSFVSQENQHFYDYSGCHLASWFTIDASGVAGDRHVTPNCYHSGYHMGFKSLIDGVHLGNAKSLCVGFQNVPGKPCVGLIGAEASVR